MTINLLYVEIARALGVPTERLQSLVLELDPGRAPLVRATFIVNDRDVAERLRKVLQFYELRPIGTIGIAKERR